MTRTTRLSWIVFVLLIPITSFSQDATSSTSADADPEKTKVIYTGRLFGYFRVPSLQSVTVDKAALSPCPASSAGDSEAAKKFREFRLKHPNSLLLGTGDNFAPQLEARVFSFLDEREQHTKYHPANKELHYFDREQGKWVHINSTSNDLGGILKSGKGTIPTDNVACFLAAAGYAAVVPGRHDFYFGAERLRQLARLMAPLTSEYGKRSPQMLGANLVLKTSPVDPGDTVVDRGKPEWMDTNWPKEYSLQNLPKTVYPWFQYFQIKVAGEDAAEFSGYHDKFKTDRFWVCKSKGRPNEIDQPETKEADCKRLELKVSEDPKPTSVVYKLPIVDPEHTGGKGNHFSTLTPSTNYSLCLVRDVPEDKPTSKKIFCQRFSVHLPFFYFPRNLPQIGTDYTDPDPFVFIEKKEKKDNAQPDEVIQPHEVAIFGVVDVQLGEHIGVLNFAWKNGDEELKSIVSVEDPAQALREQLDYFDTWYKKKFDGKKEFKGLKILLAQMNPQRARVLAARFPGFQIVVAGADREQSTTEIAQTLEWSSKNKASTFVAVPAPYFNTEKQTGELNPGFIGANPNGDRWTLKSHSIPDKPETITDDVRQGSSNHIAEVTTVTDLNEAIDREVKACLPADFAQLPKTLLDKLKLVTLCAMREHTSADLAIVQKRDFFAKEPDLADKPSVHVQQFLDRFVWKGDLLTLMFVPGKAIKEALKHSSRVDGEEKAVLTLDSERGRGFEQVGARYDADRDRYLINELPIEDAKTYTVVTTDYLGAGDTGYPELVSAAFNPRKQPDAFPKKLETISSIVCRKLYPDAVDDKCLPNIDREAYLDTIAAKPAPPYEQRSAIKKFFRLSPFGRADRSPEATTASQGHQQEVERRGIWSLSLRKLSLGVSALKNNMTDAEIDERFAGIGINAKRNRAFNVKLDGRGAISWHQNELFLETGIDYQDLSKGRPNEDMEFDQITNRFTLRPGWLLRFPGRGKPHFATVVSVHLETPFRRPQETFFLSSKTLIDPIKKIEINDRIVIDQERSFTVLPRIGARWQNRDTTYFEVGVQRGWEIDGFTGYQFITGNNAPVTCLPDATKTIVKCIQEKSTKDDPRITKDSIASAILATRQRSGFYWKSNFTVPFGKVVRYEFSDEGDFFAKNFESDLVTDTRIRDLSKHSLQFSVFPSLSFGPVVNVLLYQNKINKNWLTQTQLSFEATMSFDFFNRREKFVQIRSKP